MTGAFKTYRCYTEGSGSSNLFEVCEIFCSVFGRFYTIKTSSQANKFTLNTVKGVYTLALYFLRFFRDEPGGTTMPQAVITVEQEWARALARFVANQLPQAVSQVSDIQLNSDQVAVLQRAFENTLITNMGCEVTTP